MDVSQYLEIFIDETKEHLQSLSDNLMVLEKEPENKDTINEIFRAAHSMKGMAGTMGYKRMQKLTHVMEDVFSEVRSDNIKVTADLVDVLFRCLDALEAYLDNIMNSADEGTEDNEEIVNLLKKTLDGGTPSEKETTQPVDAQTYYNDDVDYCGNDGEVLAEVGDPCVDDVVRVVVGVAVVESGLQGVLQVEDVADNECKSGQDHAFAH